MKNQQLTFAREYRGLTQTELASKINGLSQSNLSRFEKGLDTLSEDLIERIMKVLDFPIGFLDLDIKAQDEGHYRKKATIKAATRSRIKRFVSIIAYMIDCMSEDIEFPEFNFNYINVESGVSPEEIARITRRQLKLGDTPIRDIFLIMEANGIIIYQWDCDIKEFDGVSILTDKGHHLVVINKNMDNDRKRFTLAHELGHIIMHQCTDFIITESRNQEKEAHDFASEFLMPEKAIRSYLCNLTMKSLMANKQYWLTSMAAILNKAKKIQIIEERRYKNLLIEMSRQGWRMVEPIKVPIDSPAAINTAYSLFRNELSYSIQEMAEFMRLPLDIISDVFQGKQKHKIVFLPQ